MKYALLGYDLDAMLDQLATKTSRRRIRLIAHYHFRPPELATTIRIGTDGGIKQLMLAC